MSTGLAPYAPPSNGAIAEYGGEYRPMPTGAGAVIDAMSQLKAIRTFVANEFKKDADYGVIPGTGKKPAMLLPGAQKVIMFLDAFPTYDIQPIELGGGHVEYITRTTIIARSTGRPIGSGIGSCSTMESKYRFRNASRSCPKCGEQSIIQTKNGRNPGGYWCVPDKGGCGANFNPGDRSIEGQQTGKVEHESIHDTRNTVLKMSKKRSLVDAGIGLACLADLYTQDIDEGYDLTADHTPAPIARPGAEEKNTPPAADRQAVNQEFAPPAQDRPAQPPASAPKKAQSIAEYLNAAVDADDFIARAEKCLAKYCPDRDATARRLALINRVITTASQDAENGHIHFDPGSVLKPARAGEDAKRDPGKASAAFARLAKLEPSWMIATVLAYVEEKRDDLVARNASAN